MMGVGHAISVNFALPAFGRVVRAIKIGPNHLKIMSPARIYNGQWKSTTGSKIFPTHWSPIFGETEPVVWGDN